MPTARPGQGFSTVVKQRTPAQPAARADRRARAASTQALIHVRDYTKGHPSIPANNHPVRHGPVVGIHNGVIVNDDEILGEFDCARAEPRMTVDTEAIFALAAHSRADARAFEQLRGSMATAWFDERAPDVALPRPRRPPAALDRPGPVGVFFASTKRALEIVERYVGAEAAEARSTRGDVLRAPRRRDRPAASASGPTTTFVEDEHAPRRSRSRRDRGVPQRARGARGRLATGTDGPRRRAQRNAEAAGSPSQRRAVDLHVAARPVAVGLAAPGCVELVVERAREALVVADHVAELDPVRAISQSVSAARRRAGPRCRGSRRRSCRRARCRSPSS